MKWRTFRATVARATAKLFFPLASAAGALYTFSMTTTALPAGVVHELPTDFAHALREDADVTAAWLDITPLARNEWICWVEDAKRLETRAKRIGRAQEDLANGKRRPCCWPGCAHREKTGK